MKQKSLDSRSRQKFVDHMFTRYSKAADRRGIVWKLTKEQMDMLLSRKCFYCGVEPLFKNKQRGNAGHYLYNGIDRLANHLGYFPENCVPCCGTCNIAKQDMSVHDFMKWVRRLAENLPYAD